jgi:hypothetical protein
MPPGRNVFNAAESAPAAAFDHGDAREIGRAFGGCYIGFGISDAAQTFREFNARQPWTPQPGTPTEGHAVNLVGYDADGITCVSYVRLFEQKWKIRPAPSKPDPDGYSFDAVIGGRE